MARQRMVTRTIISNVITAKLYNELTDEMSIEAFTVTGEKMTERDAKVYLHKKYDAESPIQPLKVLKLEYKEQLYAMTEVDFLKYAVPIEPGATKVPEK